MADGGRGGGCLQRPQQGHGRIAAGFRGGQGSEVAAAVAKGEAEIGITFTSEFIAVPGTRVVGTFPKEIEYVNGYAGAIPKDAAAEPARAFLDFLTSAESKKRFEQFRLT